MSRYTVVLLALLITLSACSSGPTHKPEERYFLVATNIKVPYWQAAGAGFVKAARELALKAEMTGPDTYSPEEQKKELQRVIGLKPAGILISPANPDLLQPDIDSAIAAGIPVITIDSDAPKSKRLTFIGTNNYQAGLLGGRSALKALGGKGNVVVFTSAGQLNLEERLAGYKAAFEGSGVKIAEVVDIHGNPTVAFDKVMEIAEKRKDSVQGFLSMEGQSAKEVCEVLGRTKTEGKIVLSMDTLPGTLEWIEKGCVAATIGQKPFTMAYFGLRVLADLSLYKLPSLTGDFAHNARAPLPVFVDTGLDLVDKGNLAAFKQSQTQ